MPVAQGPQWLMMAFGLPAKRASERVEIWRKLRRIGALPLGASGHLLPLTLENQEKFEWLSSSIRRYKGQASVIQVHSIDDLPAEELVRRFVDARSKEYAAILTELRKSKRSANGTAQVARLRRRFQQVAAIDFFESPMRSRTEALLTRIPEAADASPSVSGPKKKYQKQTWVTRPRPGIDRAASAWLITKFSTGDQPLF